MLIEYDFTVNQTRYTKAAMDEIPTFRPDLKTPADVASMIPTPDTVRGDYVTKMTALGAARDARNFGAAAVHEVCVEFLAQVRSVYRKNATVQEQLDRLLTGDERVCECITRGDQTTALWGTLPNVGTPPAAFIVRRLEGDVTKAQFDTLLGTARTADAALPVSDQDFQHAEADLHVKQATLHDFVTAALVQGRSQFPEGSAEREIIDAIPTVNPTVPPGQAVISGISYEGAEAKIVFGAPHATSYDVYAILPGETEFTLKAEDIIATTFSVFDIHGDFSFKVVGRNSRGTGPESDVATVNG